MAGLHELLSRSIIAGDIFHSGISALECFALQRYKMESILVHTFLVSEQYGLGTRVGGVLPYIRYMGMCRPKGYGF